jgi:predicted ATP-grasp superfamily ATP-dependent carboligase
MLEINSRFNLWHHPGAVAGVNIPQAVYQDCIEPGSAQISRSARADVRWIELGLDLMAFREYHADGDLPLLTWLREIATADINEGFMWQDPIPGLRGIGCRLRRNFNKRVLRREVVADCG